jgi:8-oxo-dGTP pyrophosphatase MutT (NUDIX family)
MLASKIVGALVPSAQAFDTAERRGRPRHRREAQQASFAGATESNAATKFAAEDSGHYNCWMKGGNWKTISSERHFADRNLEVVTDRVQTPAHPDPRAWTIVHRKPAVVVAPMTRDGKIILIRQERIPIGQAIWEMPSGQIDDHNADEDKIKDTALRELREETGYELAPNGELISLGYFFSSPGFTDERGYFFLARPVQPCADGPDRDEGESILDCRGFTSEEIRRMIADNEIRDANTLGICATLAARGLLSLAPR